MFANTQMGGLDVGFPDVILTPTPVGPVPVPGPNVADGTTKVGAVYHILTGGTPTHNMLTTSPLTKGNASGAGAASGTAIGPGRHLTGAFTYLVGGAPSTRMTSVALQNSTNCPGAALVPSQLRVIILAP